MKNMYPDDKMLAAFGTLNPTIIDRTNFRNTQWGAWKENSVIIGTATAKIGVHYNVIKALQAAGYRDPFDYQCRRNSDTTEVRFRDPIAVGDFKLNIAEARLTW